jgi:hypothetical protein
MRGQAKLIRGVLLATGMLGAFATAASAQASGNETFAGTIVASGAAGDRTVVASPVRASGVLNAVGRIVEVPNQPGDSDAIERDDLVFAGGSMHLISTIVDVSLSVDPRTCILTASIQQTGEIAGGTGRFAAASGTVVGKVDAWALARRNPDGSCSEDQAPLVEIDRISAHGTLSL